MRAVTGLLLAVGCYSPKVPAGAPCDPTAPACPAGQMCLAPGVCATTALAADAAADAIDAPPDAQAEFVYTPTIVACINPAAPNPAACAAAAGSNGISIDADGGGHPWDAFIRVHLDAGFSGRTVLALRLQLTAMDTTGAPSSNAGDVYQAESFTLAGLSTAEPVKANPMALATSPGPVTALQTVEWQLPVALAVPSTNLYLELESTSADGVDYWDLAGATPPQLIVDVQ